MRRGVDLIVLRWQTVVEVDVPICEACASRRTWAGRLVVPALLVLIFGWIIATVAVFDGSAPQVVGGVALMGSVPLVLWGRFRLHRWIDLRFVGAAGVRLGDDDRVARLQITDGDYASETLALSRPYST